MNPATSVLVTVYNREAYLAECLKSILASSFEDFEVIVVDDGSTDGSVEIARHFESLDSRIHVHLNPVNLGDYPNRNRAAELARGKYLKYVDSDDLIRPDGLEKMSSAMEAYPEAAYCLSYPRPVGLKRPGVTSSIIRASFLPAPSSE
jgi:glycosyltransferase involved in cell wall biosynthesis